MEHLQEFLNRKRLPVRDILMSPCQISEKVDGTALQVYYDQMKDILHFGKRCDTPSKKSNREVGIFDLMMSKVYYNAIKHLEKYQDILKMFRVLNFEIFDESDQHIISYEGFSNNMVLLSGVNHDGSEVSLSSLMWVSDELCVSVKQNYYDGSLNATDADYLLNNKDDLEKIWNFFCCLCEIDNDSQNIEGFVLNLYVQKRVLKVQNPTFRAQLLERLDNDKINKNDNFEDIYTYVINNGYDYLNPHIKDYHFLLMDLYFHLEKNDLEDVEFLLKYNPILERQEINILPLREYMNIEREIKYPNFLKFIILGFRNVRVKNPLWCSLNYQLNVLNPFIENFNK